MKTDLQLQREVSAALLWARSARVPGVDVAVVDGVVTVAGNVDTHVDRWGIERAVGNVTGVRALNVTVTVSVPGAQRWCDAEIASAVANALCLSAGLPRHSVQGLVRNGHVTLCGEVSSQQQRDAATTVSRWLTGVTGVTNLATVGAHALISSPRFRTHDRSAARTQMPARGIGLTADRQLSTNHPPEIRHAQNP